MNNTLISKNRCTPDYEIAAGNDLNITVVFFPVDLAQRTDDTVAPCRDLEKLYNIRKQTFADDMAFMSRLCADDSLCNCVQDHRLTDNSNTTAASTLYRGQKLSRSMSLNAVLSAVSAICQAMAAIRKHCRNADISLDDIICEHDEPSAVHILYVSAVARNSDLARSLAKVILGSLKQADADGSDLVAFEAAIGR